MGTGHPLERNTPLYTDMYIALRVLQVRYIQYLHETSAWERHLYRLFLALEHAKEWVAHEQAQKRQDALRTPEDRAGYRL